MEDNRVTDYEKIALRIEDKKAVEEMLRTKGWDIVKKRLKEVLDDLRDDVLFGEESTNYAIAYIERMKKKSLANAIMLLQNDLITIIEDGCDAIKLINGEE